MSLYNGVYLEDVRLDVPIYHDVVEGIVNGVEGLYTKCRRVVRWHAYSVLLPIEHAVKFGTECAQCAGE